jgi:LmbE family N-acetylglucosaminyl deacetylase
VAELGAGSAIFLQPHYDDAALSCGGLIASLADAGCAPVMVTVFACEVVTEMVGDFAAWKHTRWKLDNVDAVVAARRGEDEAAARVLGCSLRWLGFPDAIYRVGRYACDAELYGTLRDEEIELASLLAAEVPTLPEWREGTRVFVPLGAGSHVDHQLVFEAGRRLAALGIEVYAYEDCPYAIHSPNGLHERLAEVGASLGKPVVVPIARTLARRIDAIARYESQVPVIFRFTDSPAAAVEAFARRTGGAVGPAERFWPVLNG